MLNTFCVFILYTAFYLVFTLIGLGFCRALFRSRTYLTALLSPIFGLSVFALISTALMNHYTGAVSGKIALALSILSSIILYFFTQAKNPAISLKKVIQYQKLGFLSGLIFLTPLLITGDYGIFAINGADFGSYAGWGEYFYDYTLRDALPHSDPINFTKKAFTNLQIELTRPDGHWRVGNISLFAALNALVPKYWATLYTVSIAFLMAQFILAMQLFARVVMLQTLKNSIRLAYLAILLNTVFWLAGAHYIPNIIGLTYTLLLVSLFLPLHRFNLRLIIANSFILGALILLYPESFAFFPFILVVMAFFRGRLINTRIIKIGLFLLLSFLFAYLWTYESFWRCARHFLGILAYNRPGDYVGIDKLAYFSQGIGFVDYNSVLNYYSGRFLHNVLIINYIAAIILLAFGLRMDTTNRLELLRKKSYLILATILLALTSVIVSYIIREQYLVAWRSLLTISPYVWLLIGIAALHAFTVRHALKNTFKKSKTNFTHYFASAAIISFAILLTTATLYRLFMIKNIAYGATHAAIFGDSMQKTKEYLQANHHLYDVAFVDYEGSGTIQAGWEYYLQNFAYLFPEHGSGRNEYITTPLEGKRIAIISDNYQKVHHLIGFETKSTRFQGRTVSMTENNNILQTYSDSWIYIKQYPQSALVLPGIPGKMLLWLKEKSNACLSLEAKSSRENAYLRITLNHDKPIQKSVDQLANTKICHSFHQGLNTIRFEPLFVDKETLRAQQAFLKKLKQNLRLTEEESGLQAIYSGVLKAVNPLVSPNISDWNSRWNLITPPDTFPFNPHIVFNNITIEKQTSGA